MLDAESVFWFASTIAQCVVALLAFAAFVAVWRLDSITESRKGTAERLKEDIRTALGRYVTPAQTVLAFFEAQGRTFPEAIIYGDLEGIWQQSHRNWATLHEIGQVLRVHRDKLCCSSPSAAMDERWLATNGITRSLLDDIEKYTKQIAPTVKLIGSLRRWLRLVTWCSLSTIALSLIVIAGTNLLVDHHPALYFAFLVLATATAATLLSASQLGRAIFQQPEAWE